MQKKIRNAQLQKVPFMLIAGDEDTEHGTVSVRYRDGRQDNGLSVERVTELVQDAVRQRAQV
jgi:threonyl-tRNA synthetase